MCRNGSQTTSPANWAHASWLLLCQAPEHGVMKHTLPSVSTTIIRVSVRRKFLRLTKPTLCNYAHFHSIQIMSFYINYAIFTFCLFLSTRSWHHPNARSDVELVLLSSRQPPGCLILVQHLSRQSGLHCSKPLLVCPGCVQISHSNTVLFVCASQTTDWHFKTLLFCFG